MAMYVYVSEQCRKDIAQQRYEGIVERFLGKVVAAQDVRLFDRFPPPYLKKRFERQERLIAELRKVGEDSVVCCLRLLVRGSNEYGRFKRDAVRYGREHFVGLIREGELEGWLQEQKKQAPAPVLARPDGLQMGYLYDVHAGGMEGEQGVMVCESGEWVRRISGAEYANAMKGLVETLARVVEDGEEGSGCVPVVGWGDIEVMYRMFREEKILYLAAPMRGGKADEREELERRHYGILAARDVGKERILRASARAYPDLLLYDVDIWSEVQRDAEANMALSPEEAELLRSVREPQDNEPRYPLFINGRAGSGKSTMLQYLFADYLAYWLREHREDEEGRPLYLTCSGELLQRSRQVVLRLLERHHTRLVDGNGERWRALVAEHRKELEGAFEEFHRFMRQRAGAAGFAPGKHIGFSQFRRAWLDHHQYDAQAWKRYGADLSWHVIRTYIKGMSVDGEMEPEEYEELPAKQRSVSVERYEEIYNKVWKWYKEKCEREGYWDDQDIVHRIMEQGDGGRSIR